MGPTDKQIYVLEAVTPQAIPPPRIQVTWLAGSSAFCDNDGTDTLSQKTTWDTVAEALAMKPVPESEGPVSPDIVLHVRPAYEMPVPPGAKQVADDTQGTVWRTATGWLLKRAGYTATVAASVPKATLHAATAPTAMYAFRDLMTMLLPQTGWIPMHAACVQPADSDANHPTVLIAGPSGSGKSTLTTGLLLAGWQCVSDDLLALSPPAHQPACEKISAHCMMRAIRVCDDAWARLDLNDAHKQSLDVFGRYASDTKHTLTAPALPNRSDVPSNRDVRCPQGVPTCILLPEIAEHPTSSLIPVSPKQALLTLMAETIPTALLPPTAAQNQLQRIGALLRQCATYRLRAGRDLYHDPGHLATLLRASTDVSV